MTAAYRLKGIGWFVGLAVVALGFYLISLQVAAERKRLDDVTARITAAHRDIRALETEFDTRANLRQLERWNGDTLALVAPTAAQFVADDAALAALDPARTPGTSAQAVALVVPSIAAPAQLAVATPEMPAAPVVAPVVQRLTLPTAMPTMQRAAMTRGLTVAPEGRDAPALARMAEAARGVAAVARVRPQAVAMLDRQLLSDTTFGDIMSGARRESRR